ncbi:MAG: PQQ-like beta-propeller repeat protein [Bacteroidales bacterium]|jgi:outer membrane protein assembly factor BamB|nr:PQQ-like beta-propeller repeat protein [Bacteroidales bacterium]
MKLFRFHLFIIFLCLSYFPVIAQVTAQWRGPQRSGIYPDTGLMTEWPARGPLLLWSATGIGQGFSSAVSDGTVVYVTGMKDTMDYLTAINMKGELLWQVPFGPSWSGAFPESRTTPTLENGFIYVISGGGTVACIQASDGKIKWSFDGLKRYNGALGEWGVSESPLVYENKVIYSPAGPKTTLVSVDKNTGEPIWETPSLNDSSAYVSPLLIHVGDKNIIVTTINKYFLGVDADNGHILWSFNYAALHPEASLKIWPGAPKTNTITPLYNNGYLYITGGYNHVGAMFKLSEDGSKINLVWTDTILDCHHGGVVYIDGYIYGANWITNGNGNWCCIDWKTGKKMWEEKWFNKGSIIAAGGMLYCLDEKTWNVGLVRSNPQKFELISSFKIKQGKGPLWAHPAIYNGILYIRHGEELMAYDIRKN